MTTPADQPDLATWLRAQLDDDERAAQEAGGGTWATGRTSGLNWGIHGEQPPGTVIHDHEGVWPKPYTAKDSHVYEVGGGMVVIGSPATTAAQHRHIARHDPARVLAEVDAKRRILDLHRLDTLGAYDAYGNLLSIDQCAVCLIDFPCPTVRLFALPYAARNGYRDEWRP